MRRTEEGLIPPPWPSPARSNGSPHAAALGWSGQRHGQSSRPAGAGDAPGPGLLAGEPGDTLMHEALLPAPNHGFALANSAHDGGRACALSGQNNDSRPPDVFLWAVAIPDDRLQGSPILRSDGDGNSLAHHRLSTLAQNRTFRNSYLDSSVRCYPLDLPRSGHPSWHRRADCIEVGGRWCGCHHRGHHNPPTIVGFVIYILAVLCYIVARKKIRLHRVAFGPGELCIGRRPCASSMERASRPPTDYGSRTDRQRGGAYSSALSRRAIPPL